MKKYDRKKWHRTLLMMVLCLLFLRPMVGEAAVKAPKKQCHAYVVMDAGSGAVLFGQEEDKVIYPASTAKIMTAIVCYEKENGDMSRKVKTKYDIVYGTTYGTYNLGIGAGVKYTLKDLMAISLISSSADATDSLAVACFGSKKACAEAMNAKCKELGLTHTSFDNPVGSDIGAGFKETYATAREMALITRYAMTIPMIREIVAKRSYSPNAKDITANTTNWFLRGMAWYDKDKYRIIGTKSGTTNAAGDVFIATAVDDEGHEVICAYFGNAGKESTFRSIRSLYDYTFSKYKKGQICLTPANYDVRCSKDLGDSYTKYAYLGCFPGGRDGKFYRNALVSRKELITMVGAANNCVGSGALTAYLQENATGTVTMRALAHLVQKLYPMHLSEPEIKEILSACENIDNLMEEEQEAYAAFVKRNLVSEEFAKNANQHLTREQAVLCLDALHTYVLEYQMIHNIPAVSETETVEGQETGIQPLAGVTIVSDEWLQKMETYHNEQEAIREAKRLEKEARKAKEAAEKAAEETTENVR